MSLGMSPAQNERLVAIAQAARLAAWGEKEGLYAAACAELGLSRATLLKRLKEATVTVPRKRRADAGESVLTREEALIIDGYLLESTRKNNKRLASFDLAVETLRANGLIRAGRVDKDTGEIIPLSIAAIRKAMAGYGLHPDTVNAPAPVTAMASKHPNWCWQIDPSLCVLYYLRTGKKEAGLQVMEAKEFYKNKPQNVEKIINDRVWRYVVTDHISGTFYVEYVTGAESGENLSTIFINATQKRPDDPFHGVPFLVMLDPGSANTGAVFRNLARHLQVGLLINLPGRPRAKGQVEKTNDLIERDFESGLRFVSIHSLDELNAYAWNWMRWFNGSREHTRTKTTRYAAWLRIREAELRIAPPVALMRELAHTAPIQRTVNPYLRVSFNGTEYDVSGVPDVNVKDKVLVCRNPWREDAAQVVVVGEDGHEHFHVVEPVLLDGYGQAIGAAIIGETYKRHADTPAQTAGKAIEQIVTGTASQAEAEAARKAMNANQALPFGGQIDPYKHVDTNALPAYLAKRGTALNVPMTAHVEAKPLNPVVAAGHLKRLLGEAWGPDSYARLVAGWPEGVMEQDIEHVAAALRGPGEDAHQKQAGLRLVS